MKKNKKTKNIVCFSLLGMSVLLIFIGVFMNSFSYTEPIKSVSISSNKLSYEEKEPGSIGINKSAEWIEEGHARITFDLESVLKTREKPMDLLFILDNSGSMEGEKLENVKNDTKDVLNSLFSNPENQAAIITFNTTSEILSEFTNQKEELLRKVDLLFEEGSTNYYQSLINAEKVLKNYEKRENRDCILLFLTDGRPNIESPNQVAQYNYLKEQYPWLIVQGIQYEMGEEITEELKEISDNQFIADMETLNNILFTAAFDPIPYEKLEIIDYIDNRYFEIDSISDIKATEGSVKLEYENQTPKVIWTLDNLRTGSKVKLTIDVKLKKEYLESGGLYPTNQKEEIKYKIEETEENVPSDKTPILATHYQISYDGNAPEGCQLENVPEAKRVVAASIVEISSEEARCQGYQFKGWKVITPETKQINEDYLIMPEHDVVLRAEWSKLTLSKALDGEIYTHTNSTLQEVSNDYNERLWKYKASITKVVFQGDSNVPNNVNESFDISEEQDGGITAYIVPNLEDTSTYTAYIQFEKKIYANPNSSNLFRKFEKLESIEGLEYLDTSRVTDMSHMFRECLVLKGLDLSTFDTSNVTSMSAMFYHCDNMETLNVSSFDTRKVTDMGSMFGVCKRLTALDLSNFYTPALTVSAYMFSQDQLLYSLKIGNLDTSNVTNMTEMFSACKELLGLKIRNFNTENVTSMRGMFYDCNRLTKLDLSSFDTSLVTDMSKMFERCWILNDLNISSFNTSSATTMYSMFAGCIQLKELDLSHFDTSNVMDMSYMFHGCRNMRSLNLSSFDCSKVTNMEKMFSECYVMVATLNMNSTVVSNFKDMFQSAADKENAQITLNYTEATSSIVDQMIASKPANSNVVKGTQII